MARVLNDNVWVEGREYRKGSCPPPDVAGMIGDHAWEDIPGSDPEPAVAVVSEEDAPAEEEESSEDAPEEESAEEVPAWEPAPVEPPRAGPGSAKAAWVEYAAKVGVPVPEDATRDDIIAAVDAAREN